MAAINVPSWVANVATAAVFFGGGMWSSSRVFSGVETNARDAAATAADAKGGVTALVPRVTALEIRSAGDAEKFAALMRQLDALTVRQAEAAADIKTLLARVPPR